MEENITFIKDGEEVTMPFLFSYKAIKELTKLGEGLGEFENLELMIYLGFKTGVERKTKKDAEFKLEDIENWLEEDLSLLAKAKEALEASKALQDMGKMMGQD